MLLLLPVQEVPEVAAERYLRQESPLLCLALLKQLLSELEELGVHLLLPTLPPEEMAASAAILLFLSFKPRVVVSDLGGAPRPRLEALEGLLGFMAQARLRLFQEAVAPALLEQE